MARTAAIRLACALTVPAALSAPSPVTAQTSTGYREGAVSSAAVLTGRAVFDGDVPRARRFMITKDVEVCGMGYRERQEVDVAGSQGLRNVVVIIEGIAQGKPWPGDADSYRLTQEDCVFTPHVQVVRSGEELDIRNPDPVLHNIHAFERIGDAWRTMFNFGQPPERPTITHQLRPRRGNVIRLECDAHDFMLAWIYAADHPYTVGVDAEGRFAIDGIPPGTYTVRAWHPYLGTLEERVTLAPDAEEDVVFRFSSS